MPDLNEARNLPHSLPRQPPEIHELVLVDGTSTDEALETAGHLYHAAEGDIIVTGGGSEGITRLTALGDRGMTWLGRSRLHAICNLNTPRDGWLLQDALSRRCSAWSIRGRLIGGRPTSVLRGKPGAPEGRS